MRGAAARSPAGRGVMGVAAAAAVLLGPLFSWSTQRAVAQSVLPPSVGVRRVEQWCKPKAASLMTDFAELGRYREANARVKPPAPGEDRVVFFGDSITELWPLAAFFPGRSYLNRGIGGQTTPQMLLRFRQDVIELHPKVVVILAGTNDIAGNTGPMSMHDIQAHFTSLLELAAASGIRVVLSSILPVHDYTARGVDMLASRPPAKIVELNSWLKAAAAAHGGIYLDYHAAMVDQAGLLKRELADDGLHPNAFGYAAMAPLARRAINQALRQPELSRAGP